MKKKKKTKYKCAYLDPVYARGHMWSRSQAFNRKNFAYFQVLSAHTTNSAINISLIFLFTYLFIYLFIYNNHSAFDRLKTFCSKNLDSLKFIQIKPIEEWNSDSAKRTTWVRPFATNIYIYIYVCFEQVN